MTVPTTDFWHHYGRTRNATDHTVPDRFFAGLRTVLVSIGSGKVHVICGVFRHVGVFGPLWT
ncbi:hypothetical protein [Streptomyces sp. NPDC006285]|uniref:hypothetical protein n=1 Tax=Streptomyces sp. NPDC006285 TaxID=3364742 RepID=UPI0036CE6A29